MVKCAECGKELKWYRLSDRTKSKEDENICDDCWKEIELEEKRENSNLTPKEKKEKIKELEREYNIKKIELEIERLKKGDGAVGLFIILGIIGLFFFIIPGIICFIIAGCISSGRKTKIASLSSQLLNAQLETLKPQSKKTEPKKEETPLDILKKRYAEDKLTHKEFLKRKKVLEEPEKSRKKRTTCKYCKTKLNPDDDFCPSCGRKV